MRDRTRYVATLRCQTWNIWPELTVIEAESFALDLGAGKPVFAQAAVLSYLNRSRHWEYTSERTEHGPLIGTGSAPGLYLVRDAILKAPEDEIPVAFEHANARRGEIDISFAFMFDGELPSSARDSIRSAAFAFMSLINLKLGDFLTPVAPLAIRKVLASGSRVESALVIAIHSRKFFSKADLEPAVSSIARLLSVGPDAEKLRTALELYGSHFHERQARIRFLLLVIALEALASPTPRPRIALDLVTKWQEELTAAQARYANSSAEYAALDALGRELLYRRDDSIRSQIRALAQRAVEPKNPDAEQFSRRAAAVYDKRSSLVHDGFLPAEELAPAEAEAREVLEIVLRAFTADKPKAPNTYALGEDAE
jgi:hypothetical protein